MAYLVFSCQEIVHLVSNKREECTSSPGRNVGKRGNPGFSYQGKPVCWAWKRVEDGSIYRHLVRFEWLKLIGNVFTWQLLGCQKYFVLGGRGVSGGRVPSSITRTSSWFWQFTFGLVDVVITEVFALLCLFFSSLCRLKLFGAHAISV